MCTDRAALYGIRGMSVERHANISAIAGRAQPLRGLPVCEESSQEGLSHACGVAICFVREYEGEREPRSCMGAVESRIPWMIEVRRARA